MNQLTFASCTAKKKSLLRAEKFLSQMNQVIPWQKLVNLVKPYYYQNQTGRPSYDLELMIRIYCLQLWYNLGDLAMEEAVYDRRSFAEFLKLDLMNDRIPDETTILNFRHLLEVNHLQEKIFQPTIGSSWIDDERRDNCRCFNYSKSYKHKKSRQAKRSRDEFHKEK